MWFPPPLSDRSLFNWGQHKKTAKLAILRCLKFDLNLVFNPRNHDLWPLDLIPLVAHHRSRGYLCTNFWLQGYCGSWDTPNLARFWQFYSNGHLVQVWPISTMSPRHIFWRRYILERNHVLTVILRSKVIMKVKVTGQMRIIPVVTWVKFNWNWLKYSGARVISRKCQKEKSYFWPLYLGQRSNRSQSHMTSPSYISGHLVQVWSKSAQPWLSNINKCDFPPAILFQIFQLKMKYT